MSNITLVNGLQAIKTLVDNVFVTGKAFDAAIHEAAYNCLNHAVSTGDIRPMTYLYKRLSPKAKLALRDWAVAFGPFKYLSKTDELKFARRDDVNMQAADETGPMAYAKAKRPVIAKPVTDESIKAGLERLLAKATKAKRGKAAKDHILHAIAALTMPDEFTEIFTD